MNPKIQPHKKTLKGYLVTFILGLLLSGCGGGDSSPTGSNSVGVSSIEADAGNIIGIRVGETANLDGSASTSASSSQMSYSWSFSYKPRGSVAVLSNPNSVNASFIPDVKGSYMVQLEVSSSGTTGQRAIALVEASIAGNITGDVRLHTSFSSKCSDCHDGRFSNAQVVPGVVAPKSGIHVATTNVCEACHTTFGFNIIPNVDHAEVFGNCSTCHDGVNAVGKSDRHIVTTSDCNSCHTTESFLTLDANGNYDHTGITSGCVSCHNGKVALGTVHNPDTFAKSNNDCVFCHTTDTFEGAFPDHNAILKNVALGNDRCDSCHGVSASGPITGHPNTAPVDCGSCHSVKQFSLGGVFNHRIDAQILSCDSCHNDNNSINASPKTPTHIPTTIDCGICHGVSAKDFTVGIFNHSAITARCDSCHGSTAVGKPTPNHISTALDCNSCHSPGSFAAGAFDHDPAVVNITTCSSCHNAVITAGKDDFHIPTTDDCRDCHFNTTTFVGATVDHSVITNNCVACHDGNIAKGKSTNHLATNRDCVDCHTTNPLTFTGATFDHVGVTTCASCHNGVIAIDKSTKANHIPAQAECSQCHTNTSVPGGFATSTFLANVHPGISNGCQGCHNTNNIPNKPLVKATDHIPTSQDCNSCHSNTNFADQTPFTHAGISTNCQSCHSGNYFTSANAKGKAQATTHPTTTSDCGSCHAIGNNFTDGVFDHTGILSNCASCHGDGQAGASSKKNAGHVPTTQDCSVCHVPGTFATAVFDHTGIVNNCSSCHNGTVATGKSVGHLVTNSDCSSCHNTTAFAGAKFDHTGITGNCSSCHNGTTALGKGGNHVPATQDCNSCHQTTGFIPATFSHAGITGNCAACHNGTLATGKSVGHVVTNADCGLCHNTSSFTVATFDHSSISVNTRCNSCHGVTATGKDSKTNPAHWATGFDCRACHTTSTFLGATWQHNANSAGNCNSCHSAIGGARQKPATGHVNTNLQCDSCHTTARWAPSNFTHNANGNFPGTHRRATNCIDCHGNNITSPFVYPSPPPLAPFCAGCHQGDFRRNGNHIGGSNGTVQQNRNCGGSGCHDAGDSSF